MGRTPNPESVMAITGSVPVDLRNALEDYRWQAHQSMSEVVREGMTAFAIDRGIWTPPEVELSDEEKAEAEKAEAEKAEAEKAEAEKAKAADKPKTSARSTSR